jgi:hypothetical protein
LGEKKEKEGKKKKGRKQDTEEQEAVEKEREEADADAGNEPDIVSESTPPIPPLVSSLRLLLPPKKVIAFHEGEPGIP